MALSLGIILKDERQNCAQVSPLIISKSMFRIYLKIKWNKRTKTAFNSNQSQEKSTPKTSLPHPSKPSASKEIASAIHCRAGSLQAPRLVLDSLLLSISLTWSTLEILQNVWEVMG